MASNGALMSVAASYKDGGVVPGAHWENRMIKISGHVLWQTGDQIAPGNTLVKEAGREGGLGRRLETTYSTSGYSSQDSGMERHCKPQGKCGKELKCVKTKRKVGRPIAYEGDPDSPDLDPEQRQIILRRIANRRSARRGRERRQNEMDKLTRKILEAEASNAALKAKVRASESKESAMQCELAELRGHARELAIKNGILQHDIAHLTSASTERRQVRLLEPGHTTIRGSPAPALLSAAPVPVPPSASGLLSTPGQALLSGCPPDLPPPFSPLPMPPSPFAGGSPVPQMPEHYLRELLHMVNWAT